MSSEPKHITRARDSVAELRADRDRLAELRDAAQAAVRAARRGDDTDLRRASLEAAGLAQAYDQVATELVDAEQHLAQLEAEQRRGALEREHDQLAAQLDAASRAYAEHVNEGVDAALAAIAQANAADVNARQAHDRLVTVTRDLGRPEPRALRPLTAQQVVAARVDAVIEDERVTLALLEAARAHPVARGATRSDVSRERADRQARARATAYAAQHAAQRARAADDHPGNRVDAEAARAWLAANPTPEARA